MIADGRREFFDLGFTAADVVTHFAGLPVAALGHRNDLPNGSQVLPRATNRLHGVRHRRDGAVSFLQPAPGSFRGLVSSAAVLWEIVLFVPFKKERFEGGAERALVAFHGQHVVAAAVDDFLGDFFLASHGVDRDDGSAQFQHFQQLGNRRDFVRLGINRNLPQRQTLLSGPGANQMQRMLAMLRAARSSQGFSVDGHEPRPPLVVAMVCERSNPIQESELELVRLNERQNAADGVVRRRPVFQADELSEPGCFLTGEVHDLRGSVATRDGRGDAKKQDINQLVSFGSIDARIVDRGKRLRESTDSHSKTSVKKGHSVHGIFRC